MSRRPSRSPPLPPPLSAREIVIPRKRVNVYIDYRALLYIIYARMTAAGGERIDRIDEKSSPRVRSRFERESEREKATRHTYER